MLTGTVIDVWYLQRGGASHRVLREVLARYVDADPGELSLVVGRHGKPALARPAGGRDVQFSAASSGSLAVVAVARGAPVGVDIERIQPERPAERLARRWFARAERRALEKLPAAERPAAFHRCWAAKEAYVKGLGTGIGHGLASFSVARSLTACGPQIVVDAGAPLPWSVQVLEGPERYACAVAAPGGGWTVASRGHEVRSVGDA